MFLSYLMLFVALCLSAVAAFYSIVGLAAIFAAAVLPIVLMGSILEVAKLTVTVWLHEYWKQCKLTMKIYLVPAVFVLMLITSMGIFGFLSKAHSDQSLVSGDVQAKIAVYDEKIKIERDNIDAAKRAMAQMDAQVDQMLGRTDTDRGAERAVAIRKNQAKERATLVADIARAQKEITKLNNEAAPIRAEVRKVEAEVGPIKYIAALIYGDNPDQNLLERAVRWVIILLVAVFDPLAVMMLLAATESMAWTREAKKQKQEEEVPDEAKEFFDRGKLVAQALDAEDEKQRAEQANIEVAQIVEPQAEPVEEPKYEEDNGPLTQDQIEQIKESVEPDPPGEPVLVTNPDYIAQVHADTVQQDAEKEAMRAWKANHPESTIKEQRRLFEAGAIDELPWRAELGLQEDNGKVVGAVRGFGISFPMDAEKGDQFLRVDMMPTKVFKYNGSKWIEVDKNLSDQYAFDTAYIDHLITKIASGEYDLDLLSDAEREQVETRLKQQTTGDA